MPQKLKVQPLYDINKSWEENCAKGPFFNEEIPLRKLPPKEKWISLFGYDVATPIGVPSGPLLNSKWTTLAARLGFDIITYKTIRAKSKSAHPLPNILFVETDGELNISNSGQPVRSLGTSNSSKSLAITNSFGNPSKDDEYLKMDIHLARHSLKEGQILIISVFGEGDSLDEMIEEFCAAAHLAKEAGAQVIEANYSCPNVARGGSLFSDLVACEKLTLALVKAAHPLPVLVKVGLFQDLQTMEKVLITIDRAGAQGLEGINTVPMKVVTSSGASALGESRPQSGICGAPIRNAALEFVRSAKKIIDEHNLSLTLLACGGIIEEKHFNQFLEAGAKAALTATGMMWDPFLANRWNNDNR